MAALAVIVVAVMLVLSPRLMLPGDSGAAPPEPPGPDHALPAEKPLLAEARTRAGVAGLADAGWVERVSAASGIPARALAAYAGAAIVKERAMPSCGLGWTTLAAIGLIESDHGRHGGSSVGEDGTVTPPIFGVALDGAATAHIPDSDGGAIDGDADFDRAVGPMQLIPQTWRNWHVDGSGDGVEDPQNIDDAVVATSNYLCRASGDMAGREGWRAGVGAYNSSGAYVQSVADAANRYAKDAAGD
ncbi:MAG TPA: lytic murein transglycosylase [Terrimesophilobacter sp.]|nr:lytic murein transglycosylase [Terrimesophilobacter sp.]